MIIHSSEERFVYPPGYPDFMGCMQSGVMKLSGECGMEGMKHAKGPEWMTLAVINGSNSE